MTRTPPRSLQPGQVLESWVEGIGTIRNTCVSGEASGTA
jgi:2-keto-4-pentenoate hydratase/2-oxohepta-3-ene-1,7-dioic acid hydratase in catechol pathway